MGDLKSRVHIRKDIGNGYAINIYEDTPEKAVALMTTTVTLAEGFQPDQSSGSHRDRINQEEHAQQTAARAGGLGNLSPCVSCGSSNLKLISWTDKKTGQPISKLQCQNCKKWQPPKN